MNKVARITEWHPGLLLPRDMLNRVRDRVDRELTLHDLPRLVQLAKVINGPMLSDMSDYLEIAVGQYFFRNDADTFSTASTIYLAMYTAAPSDSGGGTEVTGNDYARTAVTFDAWTGTSGLQDNPADVDFPAANGGNWGTLTHAAILDASTSGNFYVHNALSSSVIINDGDSLTVPAGSCDLTFA